MKYVKILGLAAVAATALMAFAAAASATTLTSPTGTVYTGEIHAEAEVTPTLDGSFTTVTCKKSTVAGTIEEHGTGVTAGGLINTLTFGECNFPVTVLKAGKLEVHPIVVNGKGEHLNCLSGAVECTGTLTSSNAEVTVATSVGTCTFTTSSTRIGVLTPSNDLGGKEATLDIGSSPIPRTGGNFLCGSSATWTGAYKVTKPTTLYIDG